MRVTGVPDRDVVTDRAGVFEQHIIPVGVAAGDVILGAARLALEDQPRRGGVNRRPDRETVWPAAHIRPFMAA
ncbi:MAG: hypothetical protein MUF38_20380, partial [Anaerolineae bacterium]|nr:hypothetical protein [Anaerolineae bacterium]